MEPSGLSFSSARDILIQAFKDELSKSSHSTEHLKPSTNGQSTYIYLIVVISIYVFLALLFQSSASYLGALFSILLSSGLIYLDIYVHKHHDHVIGDEVQVELQKILRVYEEDVAGIAAEACEVEEPNVILSGITHSGICTAYRNGKWHRLPSLLLSKGDIVALMAGDLTPGRVLEFLPVEGEAGQRGWSPGAILDAGEKVLLHGVRSAQSASSAHAPPSAAAASERHRILQSDSLELLAISGDVRCFQLLETPITTYLANLMREQAESRNYAYKYPSGLTQLHFILETEKKTVLLTALFLFVVGFIARYFLSRGKILCLELTILHPLLSMLVCFVPCPFVYYFIAEVIATADLLAFMDANLQLNASESSPSANKQPSPLPHLSNHSPFEDDQASNDGFDDADSEERAEEHAEEVSSRLTAQRWIHYFFLVLRSRLGQPAPVSIADLPIPFIHARLLETMGSITFVAFIDDDVVCEGYSIAEELLLLKSSGNEDALDENKGMVLDLHANSQAKGSRFESPSWWKYLRTLKPVGLNSLLTYAPSPLNPSTVTAFRADARLRGGLAGHKSSKNRGKIQLSRMEQQLIAHVRRPMPMESLRELSEEIGFTAMDAAGFTRMLEVNLLVPQLTDRKLLEDMHAWGQDETRRRGMLVPEMRGVVVHDNSSDCLQLLSHGVPAVLLHYCKEYWDGASITPFDAKVRSEVLSVYDRWRLEDFDVIAFAYSPVPEDVRSVVSQNFKSHLSSGGTAGDISESPHESSVLFFVDPSSRYAAIHDKQRKPKESMTSSTSFDLPSIPIEVSQSPSLLALNYSHRRSCSEPPAYRPTDSRGLERSNDAFSQPPISSASEAQDAANALSSGIMRAFNMMTSSLSMRSFVADKASSPIQSRLPLNRSRSFDELSICEMPPQTSIRSSLDEADDLLRGRLRSHSHTRDVPTRGSLPVDLCVGKRRRREPRGLYNSIFPVMKHQIFLGMAASSVPIRQGVAQLMEDLTHGGLRFIYFSPRNMRRSKPVASKIGIPFDWNCAISLRELGDDEIDPYRHISSYADWDVHAHMPHGVKAIKKHLEEVDNVPLLVSLYTDATPRNIRDIMQIFREYGEVVLTIGSAYRLTNRAIFGDADLACGVSMLPGQHKHIAATEMASIQELPMGSYSALSRLDMLLVFRLIRLNAPSLLQVPCALVPLHQLTEQSHSIAKEIQEPVMDFSSLLEAIRMGRIFVLNATQALGTLCVCLVSLAMSPCVAFLAPLTIPSFLPLPIVLLFLFLYIPLLLLSMLFTRASSHDTVMRNTPRKRRMVRKPAEEGRFKSYLAMRCLTVLVTMALMQWLTTASLYGDSNIRFTDRLLVVYSHYGSDGLWTPYDQSRFWAVQDFLSVVFLLSILSQCSTLLHRGQAFPQFASFINSPAFSSSCLLCILLHALVLLIRSFHRAIGIAIYAKLHWSVWIALTFLLGMQFFCGFVVNYFDHKHYRRHLQFLRLEFDTRLGMHSPR